MENKQLIEKYRHQLMAVHAATVAIVSFVEIIAYFVFVRCGIHTLSLASGYLWKNVVLPIAINLIAHLSVRWINSSEKTSDKLKNSSVIYGAFVTSFVVSLFHRDYIVALCSFVFPIILSAMYNDQTLLKRSLWMALFSLTTTAVVLFFENKLDLTTSLNIVVLYGYVAVSYLSGIISIKFSQRNFSVITDQLMANSDLESKIVLDQMTGLYNHKAFHREMEMLVDKNDRDCCIAMVDVDDFKKVNDTYGHDAGDKVLIFLANVLKENCEINDYPCRYGGEEFAVIFTEKTIRDATLRMQNALKMFSEHQFEFTDSHITFSCGIASLRAGETKEQFFNRADNCMYMSKKNGKNRVTTENNLISEDI